MRFLGLLMVGLLLAGAVACSDDSEPLPGAGLGVGCADRDVPADAEMAQVFVVAEDTAAGIAPEILSLGGVLDSELPAEERHDGAITTLTEIDGLVPVRPIEACAVILAEDFAPPTEEQQASIEDQLEAYGPQALEEVRPWLIDQGVRASFEPEQSECLADQLLAEPGYAEEILNDPWSELSNEAIWAEAFDRCF